MRPPSASHEFFFGFDFFGNQFFCLFLSGLFSLFLFFLVLLCDRVVVVHLGDTATAIPTPTSAARSTRAVAFLRFDHPPMRRSIRLRLLRINEAPQCGQVSANV